MPNYWVQTHFLDNTIAGDGSIPRLMVMDEDTPHPVDVFTETTNTSHNTPEVDPLEMERTRGFVEVKKTKSSQTTLFPVGPWWR